MLVSNYDFVPTDCRRGLRLFGDDVRYSIELDASDTKVCGDEPCITTTTTTTTTTSATIYGKHRNTIEIIFREFRAREIVLKIESLRRPRFIVAKSGVSRVSPVTDLRLVFEAADQLHDMYIHFDAIVSFDVMSLDRPETRCCRNRADTHTLEAL